MTIKYDKYGRAKATKCPFCKTNLTKTLNRHLEKCEKAQGWNEKWKIYRIKQFDSTHIKSNIENKTLCNIPILKPDKKITEIKKPSKLIDKQKRICKKCITKFKQITHNKKQKIN